MAPRNSNDYLEKEREKKSIIHQTSWGWSSKEPCHRDGHPPDGLGGEEGGGGLTSVSVAEIRKAKFTVIMLQPGPSATTTGRPGQASTVTGASVAYSTPPPPHPL